jgi:hypothetical protein
MKKLVLSLLFLVPQVASARVPDWWRRVGWVDADDQKADSDEVVRLNVRGAVKLRLQALGGDVKVVPGGNDRVTVRLSEGEGVRVSFREEGGDRVELLFNGVPALRCGRLCVEVPRSSAIDVNSASGDVMVEGVGGDVRARSAAGDVKVENAGAVEVTSVSGDVIVRGASGAVRAATVSGDVIVTTQGSAPRISAATTSGDVHWTGHCGSGCRIEARTLSGDVRIEANDRSSFAMRFLTHNGEVAGDDLKLNFAGQRPPHETSLEARYGAGDGLVEVQTFSGDLHLARSR